MAEIRTGQVIDALVSSLRALPGFRAPTDRDYAPNTTVWDGPEIDTVTDNAPGAHLVVGYGGTADVATPAADSTWSTGPIAGRVHPREEVTLIACMAKVDRMDSPKAARDAVLEVVTQVAQLCRADPSLGIDTSQTIGGVSTLAWVTGGNLTQWAHDGFTAMQAFTVTYKTRV